MAFRKPRTLSTDSIGTSVGVSVKVDSEDQDLEELPWNIVSGYATTSVKMHRLIMERVLNRRLLASEYVDHINRNPLDNRRSNLRVVTPLENRRNSESFKGATGFIGVHQHYPGRWRALIRAGSKQRQYYIGSFNTPEEAAWMRDQWALALFGSSANLNFDYSDVESEILTDAVELVPREEVPHA